MRNSPWYLLFLASAIACVMGWVFATSEIRTIEVSGKRMEENRSRRGLTGSRYVIETNEGDLRLLNFPIIGYMFGAEEVFAAVQSGARYEARIGTWPPPLMNAPSQPHILDLRL